MSSEKIERRSSGEIKSLSLESRQSGNNNIKNPPINRIGLTNRNGLKNNRPIFISPEVQREKIFAFLIILSLLVPPTLYFFIHPNNDNSLVNDVESHENPEWNVIPDRTITFTAEERLKIKKNPKITGTRGYIGTSPPVGDWIISGDAVVWNETIILNGDLTVTDTGNLTLINVTLKVNCSYNGEYHIEVLGGGGFFIYDFDWDRFTQDDASYITALNTSNKYLFWVRKGSNFEMRNSKMSWCGYEWGTNGDRSGLWVNTDFTIIEGNLITNMWNGIIFYKSTKNTIMKNTIRDSINLYGDWNRRAVGLYLLLSNNNLIINNTIANITGGDGKPFDFWLHHGGSGFGIYLDTSNNNNIFENDIYNITGGNGASETSGGNGGSGFGIYIKSSNHNNITYNTIFNNIGGEGGSGTWGGDGGSGYGIYIQSSSRNNITDVIIHNHIGGEGGSGTWGGNGGSGYGIYIQSSSRNNITDIIIHNHIGGKGGTGNWVGNGGLGYGISIHSSQKLQIYKCSIFNNSGRGIYSTSSSINNVINNTIYNNSQQGIYLTSSSKNNVINNSIYGNKAAGVILISSKENNINNNVIFDNSARGIILTNCQDNVVINNIVLNNSDQGIAIVDSSKNAISNNSINNNSKWGIWIKSSMNNNLTGCNILNNQYGGIYSFSSSSNNIIVNSSIISSNGYDLRLASKSQIIALNTSFNRTNVRFDDASSTLTVQWYLHIKVTNLDGMPIMNANIRIRDNTNGTFDVNFSTDSFGLVRWIVTTEYVQDSSTITNFTPHNITATVYKYIKEYVCYSTPEPWMNRSKTIIITFGFSGDNRSRYQTLYPGWNLISFPYIQSNPSIQAVLKPLEGCYKAVQWYNSTDTLDNWKHYHISKPSYLNDLDELNHKIGFWIYITSPEESGFLFNGTLPITDQMITLYPGWNLVGYPSLRSRFRDDALNNLQYGSDIQIIYYYDAKTRSWDTLEADERMRRGVGYWFYTNSTVTWIVNTTVPPVYNIDKNLYYDTIQEGIDDADELDILEISSGIFYEKLNINKSLILVGNGMNRTIVIGDINITSDPVYLSTVGIHNSTYGITLKDVNEAYIYDVSVYNCTYGLFINSSINIDIKDSFFNDCIYGIFSYNSSNIMITNSTITEFSLLNFLLSNSNITILNTTFNITKVEFLNANSNLTIQWFLHVLTRDQLGSPISGTTIRVMDNENGTFDETYYTDLEGYVRWIIITERIQNLTENITFTPYNISATNPDFSFYDIPREVIIDKTTTVVILSVNTVSPTSILNVNRNRYYLTINEAIDDANPYDTIQLSSGTYHENITIDKPLTLVGEDMYSTIINGSGEICINITSNDVAISNLNIQNSTYGIYLDSYNGITISDIIIPKCTHGAIITKSSSISISNINIENSTNGLYFESCNGLTISNIMAPNSTYGISIVKSSSTSLSDIIIYNSIYGLYVDSCIGTIMVSNIIVINSTYGVFINRSSPIFDGCIIEQNDYGILSYNSSYPSITNGSFQNEILDFSISDSDFNILNTHFNTSKVMFLDLLSNLTVKWFLHVLVQDANSWGIPGANVWIVDNENGTLDENFTTGPDGYVWNIILTERIQNLSGNVSFNPYWVNVSYYDTEYGFGWLTFPDNPRNVSVNGTLFQIRKETFTSLEIIPEFSHILLPIMAIIASFVVLRKKRKKIENF